MSIWGELQYLPLGQPHFSLLTAIYFVLRDHLRSEGDPGGPSSGTARDDLIDKLTDT